MKNYNVLFIDNPIGTGFSYATSSSGFARTNAEIAHDLVECMKGFLKELPEFQDVPTYITTESYGGKMGAEFALKWYKVMFTILFCFFFSLCKILKTIGKSHISWDNRTNVKKVVNQNAYTTSTLVNGLTFIPHLCRYIVKLFTCQPRYYSR